MVTARQEVPGTRRRPPARGTNDVLSHRCRSAFALRQRSQERANGGCRSLTCGRWSVHEQRRRSPGHQPRPFFSRLVNRIPSRIRAPGRFEAIKPQLFEWNPNAEACPCNCTVVLDSIDGLCSGGVRACAVGDRIRAQEAPPARPEAAAWRHPGDQPRDLPGQEGRQLAIRRIRASARTLPGSLSKHGRSARGSAREVRSRKLPGWYWAVEAVDRHRYAWHPPRREAEMADS